MADKQPQPQISEQDVQNAKDPNHPAHPDHPHHGDWLKKVGEKFGNAAIFGAGATAGSDAVKAALGQ